MKNDVKLPLGISIIYFNDKNKNMYASLPQEKELAKSLSKRIYKDVMIAICIKLEADLINS